MTAPVEARFGARHIPLDCGMKCGFSKTRFRYFSFDINNIIETLARPERFELPTAWFVARYSIQLSYGRAEKGAKYRAAARRMSTGPSPAGGPGGRSGAPSGRREKTKNADRSGNLRLVGHGGRLRLARPRGGVRRGVPGVRHRADRCRGTRPDGTRQAGSHPRPRPDTTDRRGLAGGARPCARGFGRRAHP